jgi:hypothetical protein
MFPSTETCRPETSALYMTETHPPPPAAQRAPSITPINSICTVLLLKILFEMMIDGGSTALTAPPHDEHVGAEFEHVAVFFSKRENVTFRVLAITPIAPPTCAVLLKKVQLETETTLDKADTAPPVPLAAFELKQF